MTDQQSPTPASAPPAPRLKPGVAAARKRLPGSPSQEEIADRLNISINTYRPWDQGKRKPREPEMQQLLSRVLDCPIDVIWPPEDHPQVAVAMEGERTRAENAAIEAALDDPKPAEDLWTQPTVEASKTLVPDVADVLETLDLGPARVTSSRRRRGVLLAVLAAATVGVGAGVVALAGGGGEPTSTPASQTAPTAAAQKRAADDRARQAAVGAMSAAAERGDFNDAIDRARALNDTAAERRYQRAAAAATLVRRADVAARRGELGLARDRLRTAQRRYGVAPGAPAVEQHIARILRERAARAATKKRKAQAAEKRRLAAQSAASSSSSAGAADQSPAPSSGTPSTTTTTPSTSSSGGGSSSAPPATKSTPSGGSGHSKGDSTVDPDFF